jgi:hypothetical protein
MASFNPMRTGYSLFRLVAILFDLAQDVLRLLLLGTPSHAALRAENIFLYCAPPPRIGQPLMLAAWAGPFGAEGFEKELLVQRLLDVELY